jgi:hypothetical protein
VIYNLNCSISNNVVDSINTNYNCAKKKKKRNPMVVH